MRGTIPMPRWGTSQRHDMTERETLDLDVLFVGAGPASLAGACHLARLLERHNSNAASKIELSIAVLEKGAEIGAHGLSGAVVDPRGFQELFPEKASEVPYEAEIHREHLWWMTEKKVREFPVLPPALHNEGKYVASLGKLVKWMAKEAEALGVDVFCEFPGREILLEEGRVVGVRTGDRGVGKEGQRKANFEPA